LQRLPLLTLSKYWVTDSAFEGQKYGWSTREDRQTRSKIHPAFEGSGPWAALKKLGTRRKQVPGYIGAEDTPCTVVLGGEACSGRGEISGAAAGKAMTLSFSLSRSS
jgi:hypothetical protein